MSTQPACGSVQASLWVFVFKNDGLWLVWPFCPVQCSLSVFSFALHCPCVLCGSPLVCPLCLLCFVPMAGFLPPMYCCHWPCLVHFLLLVDPPSCGAPKHCPVGSLLMRLHMYGLRVPFFVPLGLWNPGSPPLAPLELKSPALARFRHAKPQIFIALHEGRDYF